MKYTYGEMLLVMQLNNGYKWNHLAKALRLSTRAKLHTYLHTATCPSTSCEVANVAMALQLNNKQVATLTKSIRYKAVA